MYSINFSKTGGPEVLKYEKLSISEPKENEVLIKHSAIGLNFIDTYHRSGLYPVPLPSGIGLEGAGIIEKVGPSVKNFKEGDKVAYAAAPLGSYSTHRIYPTKNLVKVPDGIDLEIVACLMTKGLTTFYLLHKTYPVKKGQTVLFHAAAGGVGQIFCQWAKSLGCKVIGTVGSDEKIKLAKKFGCDEVINYNKENFKDKVLELTNHVGLPVVYDGVGKNILKNDNIKKEEALSVLIGPEGDFSPAERESILKVPDVKSFTISKNILRSDTAVITAISLVNFVYFNS